MAEIAIAIAGFSGVAAVLGRRAEGQWASLDVLRLRVLLRSSFGIVIFCFLPIVLSSASVTAERVWALSSGAYLVNLVVSISLGAREARRIVKLTGEPIDRPYTTLITSLGVGIFALHALNAVVIQEAWLYLAGLVTALMVPFANFLRLLRSVLRSSGERPDTSLTL